MYAINKYLLKKLLFSVLLILLSFTSLIILIQMLRLLFFVINNGVSFFNLFAISLSLIPNFIVESMPFALIIGTIFTWNQLINNKEIIIMQSCGIKPFMIAKSIIYVGIIISLLSVVFAMYIYPKSFIYYKNIKSKIYNSFNVNIIEQKKFTKISDTTTFYVDVKSGNKLQQIVIYNEEFPQGPITIYAQIGYIETLDNEAVVLLENVSIFEENTTHKTKNVIKLDKYIFKLSTNKYTPYTDFNNEKAMSLTSLAMYKNLHIFKYVEPKSSVYLALSKPYILEFNRRVSNIIFPLLSSLIIAYSFSVASFSRIGNIIPVLKSLVISFIIKIINVVVLYNNDNKLIINSIFIGYFLLGIYLLFKLIYPPNLKQISQSRFL